MFPVSTYIRKKSICFENWKIFMKYYLHARTMQKLASFQSYISDLIKEWMPKLKLDKKVFSLIRSMDGCMVERDVTSAFDKT